MVTSRQKALVQESFASIEPILEDVTALLYGRIFELDPAASALFPQDMASQYRKVSQMLTAAVKGLDHLEQLVPVLQDLGRRHAAYGVTQNHYDTGGAALMWTLEKGLGSAFTPELKEAWASVWGLLTTTMYEATRLETAAA
jgi:hemoglobin-like flavoprotein